MTLRLKKMNHWSVILVLTVSLLGDFEGKDEENKHFFDGEAIVLSEVEHVEFMKTHAKGLSAGRTMAEIAGDPNRRYFIHLGGKAGIGDILRVSVSKKTGKVEGWRINTKVGTGDWFPKKQFLDTERLKANDRCKILIGISKRYEDGSASKIFVSLFSWVNHPPKPND